MLDDDGYLFLTGRLKEQINRGGEKISPLEIDEVAAPPPGDRRGGDVRHPPRQARRGGRRRRRAGRRAARPTEQELRAYLARQLAAFKVPEQIVFVDEIPKGATGKVQRIGLAEPPRPVQRVCRARASARCRPRAFPRDTNHHRSGGR